MLECSGEGGGAFPLGSLEEVAFPHFIDCGPPRICPRLPGESQPEEEATEEDWERREQHRTAAVWAVKRSPQYTTAWTAQVPRPRTPDPFDRRNKRPWENGVKQWRKDLQVVVSKLPPEQKIVSELLADIFDDVFDEVFKSRKSQVQYQ